MSATSTSLVNLDGKQPQPSEQAAAAPSILIDSVSSNETVNCLTAILLAVLGETLSSDAIYLALDRAERLSKQYGVSEAEFARVRSVIFSHWAIQRGRNPISNMF